MTKNVSDFIDKLKELTPATIGKTLKYGRQLAKTKPSLSMQMDNKRDTYLEEMCILDTYSILLNIMLPTPNRSDLFNARVAALAGGNRLEPLTEEFKITTPKEQKNLIDDPEVDTMSSSRSNLWSEGSILGTKALSTFSQYTLGVVLSHGSGITFHYDHKTQAATSNRPLREEMLKGTMAYPSIGGISSHIHTYDKEKNRVIDDKVSWTKDRVIFANASLSLRNIADRKQMRVDNGAGIPFFSGKVSDGSGGFGSWLCVETKPLRDENGALTVGLEGSAPLNFDQDGHFHLLSSAGKISLFGTGPKIEALTPHLFDTALKTKRDSLHVNLIDEKNRQKAVEILKMSEQDLKNYAVGMLLGINRPVNEDEYNKVYIQMMEVVKKTVPPQNRPNSLNEAIQKAKSESKAISSLTESLTHFIVRCKSEYSFSGFFFSEKSQSVKISAAKKFLATVIAESEGKKYNGAPFTGPEIKALLEGKLTETVTQFKMDGGTLPKAYREGIKRRHEVLYYQPRM